MATTNDQFGILDAMKHLGLVEVNNGTSTGLNSFSNGRIIESYSPATGELIGKVKATTAEDYEKVMQTAQEAFKSWKLVPAPKKESLFVK